jgi:ubiquinone/menaquinone biosynthesis C-methylase UbiE
MFSYVFMKVLEGRPPSYDQQMDRVSGGRVRVVKEAVVAELREDIHVLEIGCGTGELASMLIEGNRTVEGFDLSPSMISVARERIGCEGLQDKLKVRRMGVEGMDCYGAERFDAVVSTLVFSELNEMERGYALRQASRVLKPLGMLVIADEVIPVRWANRAVHTVVRAVALAGTYLVTGRSTHPIDDLAGEIQAAGFRVEREERSHGDAMSIVIAHKGQTS